MKFALRDDDTSYFTTPERLEAVYHDVWDQVPVSLAVVPHAAGFADKAIPRQYWQAGRVFPLEENPAIVARLKDLVASKRAIVMQHGFTHEDFPGGPEFQAAPDLEWRLTAGRSYLETLLAVAAAGLNVLGSFLSFRPSMRPWDGQTPGNWWRVRRYRTKTGRTKADALIYPHVLRYASHAEFGCHSLVPGTKAEELIAGFEEARRAGGHFCLATHYWEVDATLKDVLRRVLDHAARCRDVEFVSADRLFNSSPQVLTPSSRPA
jgi:hypothetical protein